MTAEPPNGVYYDYCTLNDFTRSSLPAVTALFGKEPISIRKVNKNESIAIWSFGKMMLHFRFRNDRVQPQPILPPNVHTLSDVRRATGRPPDWTRSMPNYDTYVERWFFDNRIAIQFSGDSSVDVSITVITTGTKEACDAADLVEYGRTFYGKTWQLSCTQSSQHAIVPCEQNVATGTSLVGYGKQVATFRCAFTFIRVHRVSLGIQTTHIGRDSQTQMYD